MIIAFTSTEKNWEFAYLTSARPEGFGVRDIFVCSRNTNNNCTELINLGRNVNTIKTIDARPFYPISVYSMGVLDVS